MGRWGMNRNKWSFHSRMQVAAALFLAAGTLAAQPIPDLYGRFRGSGHYEMRGANDKRAVTEASIDLKSSGALIFSIRGAKVDVRMSGRATEWTGKHQFHVVIDQFDGQPADLEGWIRVDDRGGFEHLGVSGQKPGRIGVSFERTGPNLATSRPAEPVVQPPIGSFELSEEPGTIRRGTELNQFRTGFVRDCVAACRNDSRCQGYTYLTEETRCYLLATVSAGEANRNATSGVKRASSGVGGSGTSGFDVRPDTNQTGATFSDVSTPDVDTCMNSCAVNSRCRAFTYNQGTRVCYLKDSAGEFRTLSGRISGVRRN